MRIGKTDCDESGRKVRNNMTWDELYKKIEKDLFSSMSENTAKGYLADIKMFEFSDKPCRAAVERKRKEWQDKGLSGVSLPLAALKQYHPVVR